VVSNTYCVVFLFVFILDLVCPMLPVSLDCPLLIATSVFSNVYLLLRIDDLCIVYLVNTVKPIDQYRALEGCLTMD